MQRGYAPNWAAPPASRQPQLHASAVTYSTPFVPFTPPSFRPCSFSQTQPAFARQPPRHPSPPHTHARPHDAADIPARPLAPQPHSSHPAARHHAWQRRLDAAHAALLTDLEVIGDDEARRRLRIEAHNDLVYRWSWEREVNPGPGGARL